MTQRAASVLSHVLEVSSLISTCFVRLHWFTAFDTAELLAEVLVYIPQGESEINTDGTAFHFRHVYPWTRIVLLSLRAEHVIFTNLPRTPLGPPFFALSQNGNN